MKLPMDSKVLEQMTSYFKVRTPSELYYQIGEGIIPQNSIKRFKESLAKEEKSLPAPISDAKTFTKTVSKLKERPKTCC